MESKNDAPDNSSSQNDKNIQDNKPLKITRKKKDKDKDKEETLTTTVKRKKKTNFVCNSYHINNETESRNLMSDDENIIMQLNVQSPDKENELFLYDLYTNRLNENRMNSQNEPNNISETLPYESIQNCEQFDIYDKTYFETNDMKKTETETDDTDKKDPYKVVNLLKDFEEKNKNNEWPLSTNISCYWCCHRFFNEPLGIPVKYSNEQFHVFGCFCSLECAQAYNFSMRDEVDDMWERSNLINLLSRRLKYNKHGFVKPAPPRLSLKMFGGHLSIEEFRNFTKKNKIVNINFPPMLTVTQQIEEINESDVNNDHKFIPIDTDRINKYKEKIRLKRSKPVHDLKNTLDNAINIKISNNKN